MIKYIITAISALALSSCEGLQVSLDNENFKGSYSSKGGLLIVPQAIQIIEPAK